ncbi:MAG TPA: DUF433 domain-containing protein [Longimicrobiaceae bacterium]|jgi:uncharacterized protein (DUF433 family)
MPTTAARTRSHTGFSPREAAFATGLSEKTINQAIDRAEVGVPGHARSGAERLLGFPDLLYLRLRGDVGRLLSAEGKRRLRQQLAHAVRGRQSPTAVSIGVVEVQVESEARALEEKLARIEEARTFVVSDPEVRAGEPVVRGTRIPVHALADLASQGADHDELLEDYPALTRESLEAALLYARMYPRRGRPRRAPWKERPEARSGGTR